MTTFPPELECFAAFNKFVTKDFDEEGGTCVFIRYIYNGKKICACAPDLNQVAFRGAFNNIQRRAVKAAQKAGVEVPEYVYETWPDLKPKAPPARRTPAAPQFKLRRKLQALAERGINGEKTAAIEKLARLEARYDFTQADPETKADLFAGVFHKSTVAARVFHFTDDQNDVAANVKWAIEQATGIPCLFRDRDLYAEAAPSSAAKLADIAGIVTEGFDRLWATIATVPTITPGDRSVFHAGLYDGMMGDDRTGMLPTRAAHAGRRCRKVAAPTVAIHPYAIARGLGQQIRFNVPLGRIAGDLEETVKKYITQ